MATLEDLERAMRNLAARTPQNASNVVARSAIVGLTTVVLANPVDSGRSRGNWFLEPNIGSEEFDEERRDSITPGRAIAAGIRPDDDLHLTNNTVYINRLNDGHSAQAPAGFIEDAVVAAAGAVLVAGEEEMLKGFDL